MDNSAILKNPENDNSRRQPKFRYFLKKSQKLPNISLGINDLLTNPD